MVSKSKYRKVGSQKNKHKLHCMQKIERTTLQKINIVKTSNYIPLLLSAIVQINLSFFPQVLELCFGSNSQTRDNIYSKQ